MKCGLCANAKTKVLGEGNLDSSIFFIGEAPGRREDEQGRPFVGSAGKLLDKLLIVAGIERKDIFITNIVHHRPPENRDPLPNEIESYGKYLDKIIDIIKPKMVITLGRFSMAKFLPDVFISQVHGKSFTVGGVNIIPMYHPAASLRNGKILEAEKADFLKLKDMVQSI
ncbi:MAG: uracil-DNA glycosylase [Clostridiales bacterium]|nr:uracil-DNA glycosylase [Clostridiales bacterium]